VSAAAAVITGVSGGIGAALLRAFSDAGYATVGLDVRPCTERCDTFVETDLHRYCRDADYRSEAGRRITDAIGGRRLHVLVNNAAVQVLRPVEALGAEDWERSLAVNLVAPFLLSQLLLSGLEAGHGSIVNIGSIHAALTKPGFVCYATTKAALAGLTRSLAVEVGARVRVNAIAPAAVDTTMLREGFAGRERELAALGAMHPAGRIASPREVALATVYLASESAGFVNGATLGVDGGMSARLHDPQ